MAFPVDVYLLAAVALMVIGVIGSVAPLLPGAFLSVVGVLLYWWSTGFTEPNTLFVAASAAIGLTAVIIDYFAGAISAKAGGASNVTVAASAVMSLFLFFLVGPLGILIGVAGTVFAVEFYRTQQMEDSVRAALYATIGLLASTAVQLIITVSILLGFLLAVLL